MTDTFRQHMFDRIDEQAGEIRRKLDGGMYYGIPISEYPNQDNIQLVIAYHLHFMESLATKVEGSK